MLSAYGSLPINKKGLVKRILSEDSLSRYRKRVLAQMQIGGIAACLGIDNMIEVDAGLGVPSIAARMHRNNIDIQIVERDEDANDCRTALMGLLNLEDDFEVTSRFTDLEDMYFGYGDFPNAMVAAIAPHVYPIEKLFKFVIDHNTSFLYVPCDCYNKGEENIDKAVQMLKRHAYEPAIVIDVNEDGSLLQEKGIFNLAKKTSVKRNREIRNCLVNDQNKIVGRFATITEIIS